MSLLAFDLLASRSSSDHLSIPFSEMSEMHAISWACFAGQLLGYVAFSSLLQWLYYRRTPESAVRLAEKTGEITVQLRWKVQPQKLRGVGQNAAGGSCWWPALPSSSRKSGREKNHALFATVNLLVASLFAAFVAESTVRGWSSLQMTFPTDYGNSVLRFSGHVLGWFAVAYVYENVVEYVWHRAMHLPWCYRTMHKYHHTYKAPEPFDDLYIHPLEAAGYYCVLHSPAFLFPQPLWSYLLYMAWMGATGVLDHSGVKLELPFDIYDTEAHDMHHSKTTVNFGFPHVFMDVLCGTYVGSFLGMEFDALATRSSTKRA